ncbi:MAG: thiolase family protein [Alphaproteobacteria bacterium]|nr:thiolase family protein [Alphaproteobacteria bacterium]
MEKNVVIAGYARSPFGIAHKGTLTKVRPDDLVATVVKALIEKTGVNKDDIETLILGCAVPEAEQGFNMGRYVVFLSDLPVKTGGITVNRWCGSSMQAIHMAAGDIQLGAGEAFIAAGVESMTRVPMMGYNPSPNAKLAKGWPETYYSMGQTAEEVAKKYQVTREVQQDFAIASHQKAEAAREGGRFKDEIVPIETPSGDVVDEDGGIRADSSQETLSGLKPAFDKDGTVTAGTSSPLTDGASAVLVCTEDYAKANKLPVLARIKAIAGTGLEPEIMGMGPVEATRKALERAGLKIEDIDVMELNEAFASQSVACIKELGIDPAKVNLDGGAIALGHPLGASGARITGKAASNLAREGGKYAVATMCIGGGQGIATVLEAV